MLEARKHPGKHQSRWLLILVSLLCAALVGAWLFVTPGVEQTVEHVVAGVDSPRPATTDGPPASPFRFRDVALAAGLDFHHHSPLTRERHLHLFMGSGVAWIDYDGDGWPDLFACQGVGWNEKPVSGDLATSSRLFRNLGDGTFADVTLDAGLLQHGYSMGAAVGDYDNDGWPDLYVSRLGLNQLYHNRGDGTFEAAAPETANAKYGASCTFADTDNDGDLDLYVVNYLDLTPPYPLCKRELDGQTIGVGCHPRFLKAEADVLYRNDGDGSFADASESAGLRSEPARQGLGVVSADFDDDGDSDFYIANDSVANQLWINNGRGQFQDEALHAGVAFNRIGVAEAGMGVATADFDGNGRLDLFVTNFFNETNTLYRNDGANFTDVTAEFGLAAPSRLRLGFGASCIDADNDGWEDLFVANGHIHTHLPDESFAQRAQIFWNRGGERFSDASAGTGDYFASEVVGRGTAVADFDRDGRADLAVQHLNGPLALLRNDAPAAGKSLRLELIGTASNRSAIGAIVHIEVDSRTLLRARVGSSSYLSCDEGAITVGLGDQSRARRVHVRWPSGRRESWDALAAGHGRHQLLEGSGRAAP